jgi:hypothetical protein
MKTPAQKSNGKTRIHKYVKDITNELIRQMEAGVED